MSYGEREINQEQQEQSPIDIYISNLSNSVCKRQRAIYQVDKGHRSKQTAEKYRVNFRHFLDYIRAHDIDVLLDLGRVACRSLLVFLIVAVVVDKWHPLFSLIAYCHISHIACSCTSSTFVRSSLAPLSSLSV